VIVAGAGIAIVGSGNTPDLSPPSLFLTSPNDLASVSGGGVTFAATCGDNVGCVGVQFLVDGAPVGAEDTTAPFSIVWDSTTVSNATHVVTAVGRDAAGNAKASRAKSVAVSNVGSTPGLANLWVDQNGGTCTRTGGAGAAYVDAAACSSANVAFQAAATAGDLVRFKCGTYDAQTLSAAAKIGMTTFRAATYGCATIQATTPTFTIDMRGQSWVTWDGFVLNSYQTIGGGNYVVIDDVGAGISTAQSQHVTLTNNQIDVGKLDGGSRLINLHEAQYWQIGPNNIFGGSCCGLSIPGSPVAVSIGKPTTATASCSTQACHDSIIDNLFQYADLRDPAQWPVSLFGAAPEAICNAAACHADAIQIFGAQYIDILRNRFYGNACTDIEIQPSGLANEFNGDFNIVGNTSTNIAGQCNGFLSIDGHGTNTISGTWNVGFNESPAQMLMIGWSGAKPGTVFNIYGNDMPMLMENQTTFATIGCTASGAPGVSNVTFNYDYNVFPTATPTGPCGARSATGSTEWVNPSAAPATGLDMHKTGALGAADNYVVCANLTIGLGCPLTDFDGDVLAAIAEAGADQRATAAGTGGASTATCSPSPCTAGTIVTKSITVTDWNGAPATSVTRNYWVNRPNNLTGAAPLLVVFADSTGDPDTAGFRNGTVAGKYVEIIIPPIHSGQYATPTTLSKLLNNPGPQYTCGSTVDKLCDDIPWVKAVLDATICSGAAPCENIDASRVYAAGGSKGGAFTQDLICDTRTTSYFTAINATSAQMIGPLGGSQSSPANCPAILGTANGFTDVAGGAAGLAANTNVSIQWEYGTNDSGVCPAGFSQACLDVGYQDTGSPARWHFGDPQLAGDSNPPSPSTSAGSAVGFGRRIGCSGTPSTVLDYGTGPPLPLHKKIYTGCTVSYRATETIKVDGGGHSYSNLNLIGGFNSNQEALDFFVAYGGP